MLNQCVVEVYSSRESAVNKDVTLPSQDGAGSCPPLNKKKDNAVGVLGEEDGGVSKEAPSRLGQTGSRGKKKMRVRQRRDRWQEKDGKEGAELTGGDKKKSKCVSN